VFRKFPYKNGVVTTDTHPTLLRGQVVEIVDDLGEVYKVRVFMSGNPTTINKKDILVN
jgi:hypothetical protein